MTTIHNLMAKARRKLKSLAILARNRITGKPVLAFGGDIPNTQTLDFLSTTPCRRIAEIGVAEGATSEGILRWLNGEGVLHMFDFEDLEAPVSARLHRAGYSNFVYHANSRRTLDSYNWSLMKLLREQTTPCFDYVYLDGAHFWGIDALAFLLLDKLLMPGGYMDFDDYDWTIARSPTINPRVFPLTRKLHTDEQIATPQVELIVDLLVRRDGRYQEVVPNKIFRKLETGASNEQG